MKVRKFAFFLFGVLSYIPVLAQVDTAWVRRYNGPGNADDRAFAMAVDDSGNVYVTGTSLTYADGIYWDYITAKYSPQGDTLWVRRYNGPPNPEHSDDFAYALTLDRSGNVYVTGTSYDSGTGYDYTSIKYAPNGDTLWVRRYNGPSNSRDEASALAVDGLGNVYVTGVSLGSGTLADYATIKYNSNGDTLWVRRYNGPSSGNDNAYALAIDGIGNVYVTGRGYSTVTGWDYTTIKYAPNGDVLWVATYNSPGNLHDIATALKVNSNGNVYVTGVSEYDYATIKYAPNGDTLWVRRYNGPDNMDDQASALVVDDIGNVYVTGYSWGSATVKDFLTIKYSPNGDSLWVRRYDGPGNGDDQAFALVVNRNGNVYVTGYSGTSWYYPFNYDYVTIKYESNGDILWTKLYNGPGNEDDIPHALAMDESGNLYITGWGFGSGTYDDYTTIKYIQFECLYKHGDANSDGTINLSDIIFKVNHLFKGGGAPSPLCRGDDNADGKVDLQDLIYEVNYIFKGGPAPLKSRECCL